MRFWERRKKKSKRMTSQRSYDQKIIRVSKNKYTIHWTIDYYTAVDSDTPGGREQKPRLFHRVTDQMGALRFARKWGLKLSAK